MTGPFDPQSWDELIDGLGYSYDLDEDDGYHGGKRRKAKKDRPKKTKFRNHEWDDYD